MHRNEKDELSHRRHIKHHHTLVSLQISGGMTSEVEPRNLKTAFAEAESKRRELDEFPDSNTESFQDNLSAAIALYEECVKAVDRISLFSPNETLEDVSSNDLQ